VVRVVGVDGCPKGWVAVEAIGRAWSARVFPSFAEVLAAHADAAAIGVDIPIGLPSDGRRASDAIARGRLGPRRSSVLPAPSRRLLVLIAGALSYRAANQLSRAALGYGIGAQAFNIFAKIRDVDALMTPERQRRVREVHPELCFAAMRDTPCQLPKRTSGGAAERLAELRQHFDGLDAPKPPPGANPDDLLDALAAAWTAGRIARGEAGSVPDVPELDPRGLRMEIVF
jgi:predicted RNase H-like nuclease